MHVVQLGMSKEEVTGVLGVPHAVVLGEITEQGVLEVWEYRVQKEPSFLWSKQYLVFHDGRLARYGKEWNATEVAEAPQGGK